jgi:hypothetical protein
MYEGVPCEVDPSKCCYNENLWCPNGGPNCDRYDRGAYPLGDKAVYLEQMFNPNALAPFPNAIVWNWATIFVLGFGCLGALDFQSRCLAGKRNKKHGCQASHFRPSKASILTVLLIAPFVLIPQMTARSPGAARMSCLAAGCVVLVVALPVCYIGAISR